MVNLKRHRHYFLWWYLLPVLVQAGEQKLKAMAVGPSRSRDGHQGRGQPWSGHEGPQGQAKARLGHYIGHPGSGLARPSAAVLQHSSDKDQAVPRPGEAPEETSHSSPNHLTPGYTATQWPEAQVAKPLGWREMPMGSSSTCQGDLPAWWETHLL